MTSRSEANRCTFYKFLWEYSTKDISCGGVRTLRDKTHNTRTGVPKVVVQLDGIINESFTIALQKFGRLG